MKDICKNCGGWKGLHRWDTKQCPFNGEENELWMESRYEDAEEADQIAALTAERDALKDALKEVISQIDQGGNSGKVFARDYCITSARALLAKLEATK